MPTALQPIANVYAGLYAQLLEQYKYCRQDGSQSNVAKIVELLAGELQLLETAMQEVLVAFDKNTAVGVQLDMLGEIAVVARNGLSDAAYRPLVIAGLAANNSGTPEQVISQALALGGTSVRYIPKYPAKFVLAIGDDSTVSPSTSLVIRNASPAGVGGDVATGLAFSDSEDDLILDSDGNWFIVD